MAAAGVALMAGAVLSIVPATTATAAGTTRYVAASGDDSLNDCLALADPCKTIGYAAGQAGSEDTISIASGTYQADVITISKSLTIAGGPGVTISATTTNSDTVFRIMSAIPITVNLQNLTISGNGSNTGVEVSGTATVNIADSTIDNSIASSIGVQALGAHATVNVTTSTIENNSTGVDAENGAMATITRSTISGNEWGVDIANGAAAIITDAVVDGNDDGIFAQNGGSATIYNSTVSNNEFMGVGAYESTVTVTRSTLLATGTSGALEATHASTVTILSSTIASTSSTPPLIVTASTLRIAGTILSGTSPVCSLTSPVSTLDAGYTLSSDDSCGFAAAGDIEKADPALGPVADNGGRAPTLMPASGSPVLNTIPANTVVDIAGTSTPLCDSPSTDQRGVALPQGSACDIGAVERAVVTVTASNALMTAGGTLPTITPSYQGFQFGDTSTVVDTAPNCTADEGSASTTCAGAADAQYDFAYVPGTLTVSPVLQVDTSSLPGATAGTFYTAKLTASGGDGGGYTWSLAAGYLPNGLTLSSAGVISGTPSASGTFTFTVSVNDPVTRQLSITVSPEPASAGGGAGTSAQALAKTGLDVSPFVFGGATVLILVGLLLLGIGIARRRHRDGSSMRSCA